LRQIAQARITSPYAHETVGRKGLVTIIDFILTVVMIVVVPMVFSACKTDPAGGAKTSLSDGEVLAYVDNEAVTYKDLKLFLLDVEGGKKDQLASPENLVAGLKRIVTNAYFSKIAEQKGYTDSLEVKTAVAKFRASKLAPLYVNREISNKVKVSVDDILPSIPPQDEVYHVQVGVFEDEATAEDVRRKAVDGEDFGKLIREKSVGITRERGGEIGGITLKSRDLFTERETRYFQNLQPGAYSPAFKSEIGWEVVKVKQIVSSETLRRDLAERKLDDFKLAKERELYRAKIASLRKSLNASVDPGLVGLAKTQKGMDEIKKGKYDTKAVATVAGRPIAMVEIKDFLIGGHGGGDVANYVDSRIEQEIAAVEAERMGIDKEAETAKILDLQRRYELTREMLRRETQAAEKLTEEDFRKYYSEHPELFRLPERRRLGIIETSTAERAEMIRKALDKGEEFSRVAGQWHDRPEGRQAGGDAGYVNPKDIPAEYRDQVFGLKKGAFVVLRIGKNDGGKFLIVRVAELLPSEMAPFEKIDRNAVGGRIIASRKEKILKEFFMKLEGKPEIRIFNEKLTGQKGGKG